MDRNGSEIYGNLQDKNIIEILRYCEINNITGILTINKNNAEALIYFRNGKIRKVKLGDAKDQTALDMLLLWREGAYVLKKNRWYSAGRFG